MSADNGAPGRRQPVAARATYRLQLHPGFTFSDAAAIAGYLADLGVTHVYLSPVLEAAPGSTHGYDVVDPTSLRRELGGEEGWVLLGDALAGAGLGRLVDIVPNHMAIGPGNAWWWDVLENGPSSVYASYFDIDWHPPESKLENLVLLPVLGDHYGRELEAGHIVLHHDHGRFWVAYYDHLAPVAPRSLDTIVESAADRMAGTSPGLREELRGVATALAGLPAATRTDPSGVRERHRGKEELRRRLERLCAEHPEAAEALDAAVAAVNADTDALDSLLERQNYRLAWWRTAAEELDYRRFFDINDLVALRMEHAAVFDDSHALVLRWLEDGEVDGLRVDHVDGLRDPEAYLARLAGAGGDGWTVVEKILEHGEELVPTWATAGTTGYDWLAGVGALLVDPSGYEGLLAGYRDFTGDGEAYDDLVHRCKLEILEGTLSADLSRLVGRLARICERHRRYRDYTRRDLRHCLAEVMAGYPVYRTYVRDHGAAGAADRRVITAALDSARNRRPDLDGELVGFIGELLSGDVAGDQERELALRAQQLTGAVMAKAVEDTAFYRYLPLASANEVGADPSRPALPAAAFHAGAARRGQRHPGGLLALSTHDTKRSEDVRARLAVLAEIPEEWNAALRSWSAATQGLRQATVDARTEWLAYQTLVGAWPIDAGRLASYLEKATREAKVRTSWTDPDAAYDRAVRDFATGLLEDRGVAAAVEGFVQRVLRPGWSNSLTQKLLTLMGPGVPDIYQGTELWDLSLVDPDNRRPVDYDRRRAMLAEVAGADPQSAWEQEDGRGLSKLCVVRAALALRARHPACLSGDYTAVEAEGEAATHLVGYSRGEDVTVLGTRLPAGLERRGGWGETAVTLAAGRWRDRLGGGAWEGTVKVGEILDGLPVALLERGA